jgi:hypothetical protein
MVFFCAILSSFLLEYTTKIYYTSILFKTPTKFYLFYLKKLTKGARHLWLTFKQLLCQNPLNYLFIKDIITILWQEETGKR